MRMIAPRTGHTETTIAEDQLEYKPITVNRFLFEDGRRFILTRWKPSDEERAALANGEDVFVALQDFGGGMTPLLTYVGQPEWVPIVPAEEM